MPMETLRRGSPVREQMADGFKRRGASEIGFAGKAGKQRAHQPDIVFHAFGIAAQPEKIVGRAAGKFAGAARHNSSSFGSQRLRGFLILCGAEDPRIFAAAALLHGDDQRFVGRRNARQAARQNCVRRAIPRGEHAQHNVTGAMPYSVRTGAVESATCSCATNCPGFASNASPPDPRARALSSMAGNSTFLPWRGNGWLDDHFLQMIEHVAPRLFLPAPPRGDRRHPQFFAEQCRG